MAALLLCAGSLRAQTLEIEKPLTLTERQEAVRYERLDFNQVPCALVILHLDNDNVDFEGDIRTSQYRNGEWWIWMIQGSNWLTVKASQFTPLTMEFKGLQSGKTYEATVRAAVLLRLAISEDFHFDQSRTDAANAKYMRRDAQGRTCALVRMGLVLPEAQITGPQVEHSEYRDGEWWVWLSPDATQMTVTAAGYQPLALQFDPVRAASTYMLTLLKEGQRSYKRTDGYVDLGLPSGTLWKDENEKGIVYTYAEAMQEFGDNIPTNEQWKELMNVCQWSKEGKITGPSGESIVLPVLGALDCDRKRFGIAYGCLWSSTPAEADSAWGFAFSPYNDDDDVDFEFGKMPPCNYLMVRLVKPSDNAPQASEAAASYVDLGLPSGTLWRSENEKATTDYDNAVTTYGNELPSMEQWKELQEHCTWTWQEDIGYIITGPNGKIIRLPALGFLSNGELLAKGEVGDYWTSTRVREPKDAAVGFAFNTEKKHFYIGSRNTVINIRLAKSVNGEQTAPTYAETRYNPERNAFEIVEDDDSDIILVSEDDTEIKTDLGNIDATNYVDLGLPSSTLWAVENEDALPHRGYLNGDYMNWDDASNFLLPSFEQAKELVNECKWAWTGKGYKVTGPNGNSIDLPALGAYIENWDPEKPVDYREVGMYWTRVPSGQNHAVVLAFNKDSVAIDEGPRDDGYTVRTVKYPPAEKKPQTDNKVYGSEEIGANPQFQGNINEWFRKQRSALGSNDMIGVNFVVESDGRVSDITVLSFSSNGDVETKALRVLKKMPKWKPAMKDGKPVRSVVSLLVDFRTSGSGNQYGDLPEGTIIVDIRDTEVTTKLGNVVATGYVDLGLPSGTLWRATNESGYYKYEDAVEAFGKNLPSKEQFMELKKECRWQWTGNGYKVTGPNGKSIELPLTGHLFINDEVSGETTANYWSSTLEDDYYVWTLYIDEEEKIMEHSPQSYRLPVRLVKSK